MSVLDNIYKVIKSVVALAHDLKNYQAEVKEIRHELRDLTFIVQRLAQEIHHSKEITASERTNILLEVENKLLHFEQRLSHVTANEKEGPSKRKHKSLGKATVLKLEEKKEVKEDQSNLVAPKTQRAKG